MKIEQVRPEDIERRSFEIITELLGERQPSEKQPIFVKRVIHTTADLGMPNPFISAKMQRRSSLGHLQRAPILSPIPRWLFPASTKKRCPFSAGRFTVLWLMKMCLSSKKRGVTRACVSMEKAAALSVPLIFAIGNAPTALLRLDELIRAGVVIPRLVIGVPVGFVNVVQSKERIMTAGVPCIVAKGRKGGSNVAAAIINADYIALPKRNKEQGQQPRPFYFQRQGQFRQNQSPSAAGPRRLVE